MVSNTRLYGAAIAFASGLYSLWSASTMERMTIGGWVMGLLGVIVVIHGAVLLTKYADRLGDAGGPLMIVYAVLMLLTQVVLATGVMDMGRGMGASGTIGERTMATGLSWDVGMVVLAALMLVSGLIMVRGGETEAASGM